MVGNFKAAQKRPHDPEKAIRARDSMTLAAFTRSGFCNHRE